MLIHLGIHWVEPVDFYQIWDVCRFFFPQIGLSTPLLSGSLIIHIVDHLNHSIISETQGILLLCLVYFLSALHFVKYLLLCFQVHWSFFYTTNLLLISSSVLFTSGAVFNSTAVIFIPSFSPHQAYVFLYSLEHMEQIHNGCMNILFC